MEPVIIHPIGDDDKEEPKTENKIEINVQHIEADTQNVDEPPVASERQTEEPTVEDHHKEILPSLAIPAETIGTKKRKKKKLAVAVAAALLLVAGVFGALQVAGREEAQEIIADPSSKDIANFRVGSDVPPFNDFYPSSFFTTGASYGVNFQIYEGLVGFEDGDTVVPLLAESWTNPNDMTWVFKLKRGVKFHDGSEMKAEDVKRSIELAQASEIPAFLHGTIKSVTVDSDHQVTIETVSPDPILLNKLAFIMIVGKAKVADTHIGTGAYKIDVSSVPTATNVVLLAFDDYHFGRPSVRKISYIGYESTQAVIDAIKNKEIDLSEYILDRSLRVDAPAGYRIIDQNAPDINALFMNTKARNSPLNKKDVRQAVALAVDHQKILEAKGAKGKQISQFSLPENFGFNPNIQPIKRDPVKAKELLKKAGYPNGLTLTMQYRATEPKVFEAYKTAFAEAGITLKPDPDNDVNVFFTKVDSGTGQLFQYNVTSALIDSYDIFSFNFQGINYQNDEFDALLEKSNATFDVIERKEILQQASKFLVDDFAAVPLYNPEGYYYLNDSISFTKGDIAGMVNPGYIRKLSAK